MKRFNRIQGLIALIGLSYLIYSLHSSRPVVVTPIVQYGARLFRIPLQVSKATLVNSQLRLLQANLRTKTLQLESAELGLSLQSPISWKLEIRNGTLHTPQGTFSAIQGHIQKRYRSYRGFLLARQTPYGTIHIHCKDFVPIGQLLKSSETYPTLPITFKDVHIYISKHEAYYQLSELTVGSLTLKGLSGYTQFLQNSLSRTNLQIRCIHNPYASGSDLALSITHASDSNFLKQGIRGSGHLTLNGHPIEGYLCLLPSSKNQYITHIYAAQEASHLEGHLRFNLKEHTWVVDGARALLTPAATQTLLSLVPQNWIPVNPNIKGSIYLTGRGNLERFRINAFGESIELHTGQDGPITLSTLQASLEHNSPRDGFCWNANIRGPRTDFQVHGQAQNAFQSGHLTCSGRGPIRLMDTVIPFLPEWCGPFFSPFTTPSTPPYLHLDFKWNPHAGQQVSGYVTTDHFQYHSVPIRHLGMSFASNLKGCTLSVHSLATPEGAGAVRIVWDYDPLFDIKDIWTFNGRGRLTAQSWQTILEDLIGLSTPVLHLCQPADLIQTQFQGHVSNLSDQNDFVQLQVQAPQLTIDHLPFSKVQGTGRWSPKRTDIDSIEGFLLGTDPVRAQIAWDTQLFALKLTGEQVHTEPLFQAPVFKEWVQNIPEKNRPNYYGRLDLNLHAFGKWDPNLQLSGQGKIDFRGPNLHRIHLLGPLSKVIPFELSSIHFNCLTGNFSFTEACIASQDLMISGPTAMLTSKGSINLQNQQITATANLKFIPTRETFLLKKFTLLFNPFTQGFTMNINGTFKEPQYSLSYNPFQFLKK